MIYLAKACEALGIACVMIGLVQGIMSESMWMELYLLVAGIVVFAIGRFLEKRTDAKRAATSESHLPA